VQVSWGPAGLIDVEPPLLTVAADHGVGEYRCACGQEYRLFVTTEHVRVWPRNGASSYSRTHVSGGSCIRCGSLLPVR
jgi:hypothetical protein